MMLVLKSLKIKTPNPYITSLYSLDGLIIAPKFCQIIDEYSKMVVYRGQEITNEI
jgi:hypothetical protein